MSKCRLSTLRNGVLIRRLQESGGYESVDAAFNQDSCGKSSRRMPSRRSSIAITGIGLTTETSGQRDVFTFLMIIMTLAEKEDKVQAPIVTIQGN